TSASSGVSNRSVRSAGPLLSNDDHPASDLLLLIASGIARLPGRTGQAARKPINRPASGRFLTIAGRDGIPRAVAASGMVPLADYRRWDGGGSPRRARGAGAVAAQRLALRSRPVLPDRAERPLPTPPVSPRTPQSAQYTSNAATIRGFRDGIR